jgi:magnesium chelatase subunit I
LQEGDIQIRGFKLRMPLRYAIVFTANPEDYTNRGSIVTIERQNGSQILTHYPETIKIASTITEQEAKLDAIQSDMVMCLHWQGFIEQSVEEKAKYIDNKKWRRHD